MKSEREKVDECMKLTIGVGGWGERVQLGVKEKLEKTRALPLPLPLLTFLLSPVSFYS